MMFSALLVISSYRKLPELKKNISSVSEVCLWKASGSMVAGGAWE
jgi:hypothetical protein